MNTALWIVQILLAALFLTVGSIKLVLPKETLSKVFEWIDDYSSDRVKLIGSFEVIGALGLFIPGVYSFWIVLIPIAATGLAIIMVLAALTHYNRGEKSEMTTNVIVLVLLTFIVVGRFAI